MLVVDEAHWLTNADRGHVWTRVLCGRAYKELHVVAAPEAEELLVKMFADCNVIVHRMQRLSRLDAVVRTYAFGTKLAPEYLPAAFVAFSRRSVVAIARALHGAGHRPAVVYGALPPKVRLAEVARLVSGDCDVIVCTDVIGHGVNLPLESIVMCETRKFDGEGVRAVKVWEAAQICGRAGRGTCAGHVFVGKGMGLGRADKALVKKAVAAANGDAATDLELGSAPVMPRLDDLRRLGAAGAIGHDRHQPARRLWRGGEDRRGCGAGRGQAGWGRL